VHVAWLESHVRTSVVPAGIALPDYPSTGCYVDGSKAKKLAVAILRRLEKSCCKSSGQLQLGVKWSRVLHKARMPVLKLRLGCGLELDISISGDGGLRAARFVSSFVSAVTG
jgi:hypothetical protein